MLALDAAAVVGPTMIEDMRSAARAGASFCVATPLASARYAGPEGLLPGAWAPDVSPYALRLFNQCSLYPRIHLDAVDAYASAAEAPVYKLDTIALYLLPGLATSWSATAGEIGVSETCPGVSHSA